MGLGIGLGLGLRLGFRLELIGVAQVREVGATLERRELGATGQRGKELLVQGVRVED